MLKPAWISRTNLLFFIVAAAISFGLLKTTQSLSAAHAKRRAVPYFFGGDIFSGIQGALKNEQFVGYMTDRNIEDDKTSMRFTQAQFALAPSVLDLNNPNHRFLIMDFTDEKKAFAMAASLRIRPLKQGPQGILLAERPGL